MISLFQLLASSSVLLAATSSPIPVPSSDLISLSLQCEASLADVAGYSQDVFCTDEPGLYSYESQAMPLQPVVASGVVELSKEEADSPTLEIEEEPEEVVEEEIEDEPEEVEEQGDMPETEAITGGLNPQVIMELINAHRTEMGLVPFETDPKLCEIASKRVPQLDDEVFGSSYVHAGFEAMDLPYWITENEVSRPTEQEAVAWWLSSSIHRKAIESDKVYSCGACAAKTCVQLFTSWQPK